MMNNLKTVKGNSRPLTTKNILIVIVLTIVFLTCFAAKFNAKSNITVLTREDGSGTKTAFMEIIDLKGKPDPNNVIIQTGTAGILAEVAGNPNAIAFESLGYVTKDVKKVKIDGVEATVQNIKSGAYKISRPLSVVYKATVLSNAIYNAFHTFLLSSDAQKIISEDGYVSIADNATGYVLNNALSGTIDISGSTSLQPLMIKLASAFERIQPDVKINVSGGGSGTGYKNANESVSTFGMISEEFAQSKAADCVHTIVCKDGIAVIVNPANPIANITMGQLKTIYNAEAGSNAIKKWNEFK
jgi:phosphate transport system substrate-binding protein